MKRYEQRVWNVWIAVLRAIGAPTRFIFLLIQLEIVLITVMGIVLGFVILWLALLLAQPLISSHVGVHLATNLLTPINTIYAAGILLVSIVLGMIPAMLAYRHSLGSRLADK